MEEPKTLITQQKSKSKNKSIAIWSLLTVGEVSITTGASLLVLKHCNSLQLLLLI